MDSMQRRLIIPDEPDFFFEALCLMVDGLRRLHQGADLEQWAEAPLVKNSENFSLSLQEIDQLFPDVRDYLHRCRRQARPLLETEQELAALAAICAGDGGEEREDQCFLLSALHMSVVGSGGVPQRDIFVTACLRLLHDLVSGDEGAGARPEDADAPTGPDFDMAGIVATVSRAPLADNQRMQLLRFFQEIDTWHARIGNLLDRLAVICREHYPLVRQRYAYKVQALRQEGGQAGPLQWMQRMTLDVSPLRPHDPLHLRIGIMSYNGLNFLLSEWKQLPLTIEHGLLFDELSRLQGEQRARQQLTADQLKALADPARLRIIRSLSARPCYVQELADQLSLTPPTLSHHLSVLMRVLLVGVRPQGRRSYYHLNAQELAALSDDLGALAGRAKEGAQ